MVIASKYVSDRNILAKNDLDCLFSDRCPEMLLESKVHSIDRNDIFNIVLSSYFINADLTLLENDKQLVFEYSYKEKYNWDLIFIKLEGGIALQSVNNLSDYRLVLACVENSR